MRSVALLASWLLLGTLGRAEPAPAPALEMLAPRTLPSIPYPPPRKLGSGFVSVLTLDGKYVAERRTHLGRPALWGTGLALILASTAAATAITTTKTRLGDADDVDILGTVMGGWAVDGMMVNAQLSVVGSALCEGDSCRSPEQSAQHTAIWAVGGLVQAAGVGLVIAGFLVGPEKIERLPLRFSAGPTGQGGFGATMMGQF